MRSKRSSEASSNRLDLCGPRRLVPTLAVDGGRQTKLPEHAGLVSRCFEADDCPFGPIDCDGWIQILRESRRAGVWASMCLWSGDQDVEERPSDQSRAKGGDRSGTLETSSA